MFCMQKLNPDAAVAQVHSHELELKGEQLSWKPRSQLPVIVQPEAHFPLMQVPGPSGHCELLRVHISNETSGYGCRYPLLTLKE